MLLKLISQNLYKNQLFMKNSGFLKMVIPFVVLAIHFLFFQTPLSAQGSNLKQTPPSSEIDLNETLRKANQEIANLEKIVRIQNASYRRNIDSLNLQIAKNIARLGQNERALNLALESFEDKYREQNLSIQEFQNGLESIKNRQILAILGVLAAAVVILLISVQFAFRKASRKQSDYWNEFQASLFKN